MKNIRFGFENTRLTSIVKTEINETRHSEIKVRDLSDFRSQLLTRSFGIFFFGLDFLLKKITSLSATKILNCQIIKKQSKSLNK